METNQIQLNNSGGELIVPETDAHNRYFDKVTELQAGDVIRQGNCKFCNHPLRAEAEARWEQSKGSSGKGNYALIIKFLNDSAEKYDGVQFNYPNVSVHLNNHYEQQLKRVRMREYGRCLADAINHKINKEQMFEGIIQSMQLKMFEIAANPDLDAVKQVDMMVKLAKSIVDSSITQAKLRGDIDALDVFKDKVQNIFINLVQGEQDENRRHEYLTRLDTIRAEMGL